MATSTSSRFIPAGYESDSADSFELADDLDRFELGDDEILFGCIFSPR